MATDPAASVGRSTTIAASVIRTSSRQCTIAAQVRSTQPPLPAVVVKPALIEVCDYSYFVVLLLLSIIH